MVKIMIEGGIYIRTLLITLLQLFYKEFFYFHFFFRSTKNSKGTLKLNRLTKGTFLGTVTNVFWALKG